MLNNNPELSMEATTCLTKNPYRSLELCNEYLKQYPGDPIALFTRHQAWSSLGEPYRALDDINACLDADPDAGSYQARALVYRELGDHERAVADLTRAEQLDDEKFFYPFINIFRAESLACLGFVDEAMADCEHIPDDHRQPAFCGLPGGDKQRMTDQIRERAIQVRAANRKR